MATASKQPSGDELGKDASADNELNKNALSKNALSKTASSAASPAPSAAAVGSVRVEIFDQVYNLRGSDAGYIVQLAEYVDAKMRAVSQQTATVDSVRLAVLAALNIADELHLLKRRLETPSPEARQRASKLANALDEVLKEKDRAIG